MTDHPLFRLPKPPLPTERSVVRPYVVTGGRTGGEATRLLFETLVSTEPSAPTLVTASDSEQVAILHLCREPTSIIEISAHLNLPVGVARVMVADLAELGAVATFETATDPDVQLVKRLIAGVRSL